MVRAKGIGMPARRKQKRPAPEIVSEEVCDAADAEIDLRLPTSSSSPLPRTGVSTRGPNLDKANAAYDEANLQLEVAQEILKEDKSEFLLAKRQHKAKMQRFSDSVDRGKASPSMQLERYYKAELEVRDASLRHEIVKGVVAEAQINAKDALLQVQAAEIARLRRIVCDTSP